jgi:RNA polymerase sigma-70 factor (ECF subfamily)
MGRFVAAGEAVDIPGIVALLVDDALLTMPPESVRIDGAAAIGSFFATTPLEGHLERLRLVPTRANRQPALAAYADADGSGRYAPYGIMVFALDADRIAGITGFPRRPDLFERLGVPVEVVG